MTVYTEEVERIFKTIQNPDPRFIVDVSEKDGHLFLLVYRPNVDQFDTMMKVQLATYLYQLRDSIRMTGTRCEIVGTEEHPPHVMQVRKNRDEMKRNRERGF